MIKTGIITVSDRAFRGAYADKSGPALKAFCEKKGWPVASTAIVPDEEALIGDKAVELAKTCSLVLLTGGTGITERDVTPEAIRAVAAKELPGFGEVMRARSFERFPNAILSRSLAAVVGRSLVICLPGSPKGAVECLEIVAPAVSHTIEMLQGDTTHQ
jgi:molybdopterin adenylyltransferase